jgi:hypothetical protein
MGLERREEGQMRVCVFYLGVMWKRQWSKVATQHVHIVDNEFPLLDPAGNEHFERVIVQYSHHIGHTMVEWKLSPILSFATEQAKHIQLAEEENLLIKLGPMVEALEQPDGDWVIRKVRNKKENNDGHL